MPKVSHYFATYYVFFYPQGLGKNKKKLVGKCWHHPKIHFEDAISDAFAVSRQNGQNFKDPEFPNRSRSGQKFTHMFLGSLPTSHVNFNKIGGSHFLGVSGS